MRAMFWAYAVFIAAGLVFCVAMGLMRPMSATGRTRGRSCANNSLSLVFGGLLLVDARAGRRVWGVVGYNAEARTAGLQEVSLWRYVTSSGFAVDVAENWQSEFLQFVLLHRADRLAGAARVLGVQGAR